MTFTENFKCFQYFNFETNFLKNENLFQKTGVPFFNVRRLKMQHFHAKLPFQKPMMRQIEWGVQNETITKNGVLPDYLIS